MINIIILT